MPAGLQVCHLPVLASPVVAIAFCPRLFALRPPLPGDAAKAPAADAPAAAAQNGVDAAAAPAAQPTAQPAAQPATEHSPSESTPAGCEELVQLPYRMVFAIATAESVFLYDTQVRGCQSPAVAARLPA